MSNSVFSSLLKLSEYGWGSPVSEAHSCIYTQYAVPVGTLYLCFDLLPSNGITVPRAEPPGYQGINSKSIGILVLIEVRFLQQARGETVRVRVPFRRFRPAKHCPNRHENPGERGSG